MLDVSNWKEFELIKLFDISAGIYYYSHDYEEGDTPYVSASNVNNGILQKINLKPDFKGNCIVTGKVGCTAFYQPEDFCATSDVNIFIPKNFELNEYIGLFITTVINFSENYKWNYGRQCRVGNSKKIKIKLPAVIKNGSFEIDKHCIYSSKGYVPDFEYIESFMRNLKSNEKDRILNILKLE